MVNPNSVAQPIEFTNPGPMDALRGPYNSLAEACEKIPNTVVEGENFRLGKRVEIRTPSGLVEYWWPNGFENQDLVPVTETVSFSNDQFDI